MLTRGEACQADVNYVIEGSGGASKSSIIILRSFRLAASTWAKTFRHGTYLCFDASEFLHDPPPPEVGNVNFEHRQGHQYASKRNVCTDHYLICENFAECPKSCLHRHSGADWDVHQKNLPSVRPIGDAKATEVGRMREEPQSLSEDPGFVVDSNLLTFSQTKRTSKKTFLRNLV